MCESLHFANYPLSSNWKEFKEQMYKEINTQNELKVKTSTPNKLVKLKAKRKRKPKNNMRHLSQFRAHNNGQFRQLSYIDFSKDYEPEPRPTKRPRNDDNTSIPHETKRRKTDAKKTNSPPQIAAPIPVITVKKTADLLQKPTFKATIAPQSGFMTRHDANYIINQLGYFIEMEAFKAAEFQQRPLFNGRPYYRNCVLHVNCENSETLQWLCDVVEDIRLWNGDGLYVNKIGDSTRMIRCGIPVPDVSNAQNIKRVLRYQNLWAEVHRWTLHIAKLQRAKTFLIVSIPEDVLKKIKERKNKLFYKLGTIFVMEEGPNGIFLNKTQMANQNLAGESGNVGNLNCFYNDDVEMGNGSFENEQQPLDPDAIAFWHHNY